MTLSVVRHGAFSGSGTSLLAALRRKAQVNDVDVLSLARRPALLAARVAARREVARAGEWVPHSKTAAWSKAVERAVEAATLTQPILFIQTTSAMQLPPGVTYAIYTDRLGQEGLAAPEEAHRSLATPQWVEREASMVAGAHRLFVMGPSTKEFAVEHYGITADRVTVVGGAPNAELGPPTTSQRCERFLFVGIEWKRKGLPDLLEAFAALRRDYPHVELDVVGGEPPGPHPNGVNVAGKVPHSEMKTYFGRADALVIPTYVEPFGIALVEALMMGIPVIGTTVGNQEWIMGEGGLAIEPGDVAGLTDAMRTMIDDYLTMRERADARRDELLATMTWDRIADRILAELPVGDPA